MKLKKTIVSHVVKDFSVNTDLASTHRPKAGDLAVFEIVELGRHSNVQTEDKRLSLIFEGDHIVAAFADRYATSQFEGYVPDEPQELYHILGAGGVIGLVRTKNDSLKDVEPTTVRMIGYCCDTSGKIINTKFYNRERKTFRGDTSGAKVILSIGSTMDSGKTTTAAFVSRGLKHTGKNVAYIKLTGTCYTKDKDFVNDCGADYTVDFSDVGFPSTYMCSLEDIMDIYQTLLDKLATKKVDYIVMEVADGLMQRETNFLLKHAPFMNTIYKTVFSCGDSLSAFHGEEILSTWGIKVSAVSGKFTMSPLLIREVAENSGLQPVHIDELATGMWNHLLV